MEEVVCFGIEGIVKIWFIVEKDGIVSSEIIVCDFGGGLGEEVLCIV